MFAPYRWLVCLTCLALLAVWMLIGPGMAERAGPPTSVDGWRDRTLAGLRREDPAAADRLADLKRPGEVAALDYAQRTGGAASLRQLSEQRKQQAKPALVTLADLAADLQRDDRDAFLHAHGTALKLLEASPESAREYADWLTAAKADPETWHAVKDDPVALFVYRDIRDPELRRFYLDQRNWLAEPLVQLLPITGGSSQMKPVVEVAKRYFPMTRDAVETDGFGSLGLQLFLAYGPVIERCVRTDRLPLADVLEVVFCHRDMLDKLTPEQGASLLVATYRTSPHAWKAARHFPLTLRLVQDAPASADALCDQYASDGILSLLYGHFGKVIPLAAEAVVKYGDVALLVLNKYRDEARFVPLLESLGVRAVPYLAQFGDGGFDRVEANRAWIDKYFDAAGKPKEAEWWTHVPIVGAPVNVVRNWTSGTPNEWGELGWAAWDIVDGTLLVASLGATAEASVAVRIAEESGKQAAKVAAAESVALAVEETAEVSMRRAASKLAQSEARELTAQGLKVGTRQAAREAFRRGLTESLLRRTARLFTEGAYSAGRVFLIGGRVIAAPAVKAVEVARTVLRTWTSVPPLVRTWVYRGLLAVGLYVSVRERVLPHWDQIVNGMGEAASAAGRKAVETLAGGLRESLERLWSATGRWRWQQWLLMLGPPVLLLGVAGVVAPVRRRVRFV